ncbi:FAD-dependent oxidoreductase, partial [Olsenella phocaeensis]
MRIEAEASCDVLVVGGGIAGTQAAVAAAKEGARVTLACAGPTFSGSSFAGSTWGVGLVGPDGADDVDDLARAIRELGQGMADPVL